MPGRRPRTHPDGAFVPSYVYLIAAVLLLLASLIVVAASREQNPGEASGSTPERTAPERTNGTGTPPDPGEEPETTVTPRLLGEGSGEMIPESGTTPAGTPGATPEAEAMTLTIPKLGLRDVPVPSGSTQEKLDREGLIRMSGSGLPWQDGSNTFIVGHTLGYQGTRVPYAFYELGELRPGDEIQIKNSSGKTYRFRVFDEVTVRPEDYWVTYPDREGRTTISLQSCVPIPEFDMRLVVQAELTG